MHFNACKFTFASLSFELPNVHNLNAEPERLQVRYYKRSLKRRLKFSACPFKTINARH